MDGQGDRMGDTLRRMSRRNRAAFLKAIVRQLDSSDAHYLMELVKRKLTIDPLSELPMELQFKILLLVDDPIALLHMARVCRAWNLVIFDKITWKKILAKFPMCEPAKRLISSSDNLGMGIHALKFETQLRRNWQDGIFRRETIAAHGASVITCLYIDEANGRLISGADNGTIGVWDLRSGGNLRLINGHQGGVWALGAEGNTLVTGSTDRTLIVWDLRTGVRLHDLIGHSSTVRCVEIVGKMIVSGSRDGTVRVWDRTDGTCVHVLTGHAASVRCIASWGENFVVSGSYDGTLRIWDLQSGQCIAVCDGHDGKVYSVAATAEYIFSGGMDAKIKVWRPTDGELVDVFSDHSALVGLLEIRGRHLVAGSTDGSLSLWDIKTLTRIRHVELAHRASITAIGINNYALISGSERSLKLWSLTDLKSDEPAESISLSDKMEVVWRVALGEVYGAVAYQQTGITRIDIYSFHP